MTKTHQIELESFIIMLTAAALGAGLGYAILHRPSPSQTKIFLPIMQAANSTNDSPELIPSPTINLPKPKITSQISPDGTKLLTIKQTTNQDTTKTYTITTSDVDGNNQQTIYTASASAKDYMNIPFNTWSPDDKYVFINRTDTVGARAIIMRADGTPLTTNNQTFDAKTLFDARNTNSNYQEATGWASETLVIINTIKQNGEKGSSYWLEVPSGAIIPLSTQF
jgi:hypothetical protein